MFTLRGTWMRGGTSKCWLFNGVDVDPLIEDAGGLDAILTTAFGAEDPRQLDGVGGGSSTTSKAAVVRRSSDPAIDVDYLFGQVAIGDRRVEWGSNCGNCATAIGLYAVQAGLVKVHASTTSVRMRNLNTGAVLVAEIATPGGSIPVHGDAVVPGTRALGVPVALTFVDLAADPTSLLPTGSVIDPISVGGRDYSAMLVKAGAPTALFGAADFGLTGSEDNACIAEQIPLLVELRSEAALRMGLRRPGEPVAHAVPKVGIIGPPMDYRTSAGVEVAAEDYDVSVRMVSMLAPHPAIGLTSAVAVAAAATLSGGLVADHARVARPGSLRLGTAAGVVEVDITSSPDGYPDAVTLHRAARRIATAEVFLAAPTLALAASPT